MRDHCVVCLASPDRDVYGSGDWCVLVSREGALLAIACSACLGDEELLLAHLEMAP